MNAPLISIFIPYYNDEKFLKQSIESVLNNDYQNFELILLNHATTDSSREIAHSYKDTRIKHIDMDINYGGGCGLLFEKMLSVANGKYIKPFCADDILKKDGLKILVEYMENNPNKDFAFGEMDFIDVYGNESSVKWKSIQESVFENGEIECLKFLVLDICPVPYPCSIIKRVAIDNILPMEKTYLIMFDMSIWAILLCKGYKIGFTSKKIVDYRLHEGQISTNPKTHFVFSKSECESFIHIFLYIQDISLVKQVFSGWGGDRFDDIISDKEDLYFYIAYKFFVATNKIYPYILIDRMFNDDNKRKRIERVFGYTIKDFREDIIKRNTPKSAQNLPFKKRIYVKNPKELNLIDLLFLIVRWVLTIPKTTKKLIKNLLNKYIQTFNSQ